MNTSRLFTASLLVFALTCPEPSLAQGTGTGTGTRHFDPGPGYGITPTAGHPPPGPRE